MGLSRHKIVFPWFVQLLTKHCLSLARELLSEVCLHCVFGATADSTVN